MKFNFISKVFIGIIFSTNLIVASATAGIIVADFVTDTKARHEGTAFDAVTGKYYASGFNNSNSALDVFDNLAAFETNTVSSTVSLSGVSSSSTYFEVVNGIVYRRNDNFSNSFSSYDANTGQLINTSSASLMGGQNSEHTFVWGGYSGVNFMSDDTDLYLFGKNLTNNWQLNLMNADLSIAETFQFTATNLGFAFVANNYFFSGSGYKQPIINQMMDLTTGIQTSVNFFLSGLNTAYITGVDYHSGTDTLYISDYSGYDRFKVDNLTSQLGIQSLIEPVEVPEPSTLAIFALGLMGLVLRSFKKGN